MLFFIATIWLISITLILIFFKGATRKEKNMEIRMRLLGNEEDK
ncbi:hypothetical protein ACQPUY_05285 [Clostridium nigeriense]